MRTSCRRLRSLRFAQVRRALVETRLHGRRCVCGEYCACWCGDGVSWRVWSDSLGYGPDILRDATDDHHDDRDSGACSRSP
jgi:hypothetical protein